jgi:CheY-like chemotaxis protein
VRGEHALFNRVLSNLIQNATKFTEKGRIEIAVRTRPSATPRALVRVEVTDTGIGIAAADQARVFDRFAQVHETTSSRPQGTGLGLAISRKICEACGGSIGVESTLGHGSLFWFEFPLRTRSDATGASASPAKSTRQTKLRDELDTTLPILVVDDNAINRNMVVDMIAWLGFETESAVDGTAALACMARRDFGAILMDIRMPGMDGYETTRAIRERGGRDAEIPIIGLSASAFPEDREAGFAAGMNDYLAKPITMTTLVKILRGRPQAGYAHETNSPNDAGREPPSPARLSVEAADLFASSPLLEVGDSSKVIAFLHDFVAAAPDTIARLWQSLDRGDFDEVSRQAHNLKGSSLFLGIDALSAMAHQLERAAQQHHANDVASALSRIKALIAQVVASLPTSTASPPNDDLRGSR